MSLIEYRLDGVYDKEQAAIERLQAFVPKEGYYVAFSGGKDSVCIKKLCDLAGVKYDAHYNVTSVDPPELVRFIKEKYPDVSREIPHDSDGKPITMWNLIVKKGMPPTRIARYCCAYLKEPGGYRRMVVTGVRWAESARRANTRAAFETWGNSDEKMLMNDNEEGRRMLESCYKMRKTLVNPIIDWEDEDVWEFIHKYNIPYCELYDKGFTRLGCIGCPLAGAETMKKELEKYPKYKNAYMMAFDKMLKHSKEIGRPTSWETAEDVYAWWLNEKQTGKPLKGQVEMEL